MDNIGDNIFEAGVTKPASEPAGGNGGDAGAASKPAGRIDPVIAIAASGNGGGNNSNGAADYSGKRGRHPGDCICGTCTAKRQAAGGIAAAAAAPSAPVVRAERTRPIKSGLIEKTLLGIHLGLVAVTKCPEFNLDRDDAVKLADSVAAVMAFHKVKITPQQEAYGDLLVVAAQVYPPMLMNVYIRKQAEAEMRTKNRPPQPVRAATPPPPPRDNVQPIRSSATPGQPAFDPFNVKLDP